MTSVNNLLVELFVEELPPKALKKLGEAFAAGLAASLKAQGLAGDASVVTPFASPRRLAAHLTAVAAKANDRAVQQKLMPVAVALDAAGNATPALLKKLAALGADASAVPGLKRAPDGKAEALFLDSLVAGATLAEGLQKAELLAPDILPTFSAATLVTLGAELDVYALQHNGPLALVELQNGDAPPLYLAGTENFYAITRYNWSSYYALAVIELGQEVSAAMSK